jgi:hypothetical protein
MSQPDMGTIRYFEEESEQLATDLARLPWKENTAFGGVVLQASCPICGHDDGIDVFVPIDIAAFRADVKTTGEFVPCQCSEDHDGRPAGKSGCGRWGFVSPHVSED